MLSPDSFSLRSLADCSVDFTSHLEYVQNVLLLMRQLDLLTFHFARNNPNEVGADVDTTK